MIDIEFRGVIKGSKESDFHFHKFIYGDLVKELSTERVFILDVAKLNEDTKFFDLAIEVEPSSVEQYTGLKDINGVKIYEGDIVEITLNELKWRGKVIKEGLNNIYVYFDEINFYYKKDGDIVILDNFIKFDGYRDDITFMTKCKLKVIERK